MRKSSLVLLAILALAVAACAPVQRKYDYKEFRAADPKSILIVPAINKSVDVDAPDYFLSTISRPIGERGYYVFPVNLTKRLMEDDGLSDADMVHANDPVVLGKMFGSDAIMYVSIERWDARYAVLSTVVTVDLAYTLKSAKTGQTLWKHREMRTFDSQAGNSGGGIAGLIAKAIVAAIEKASPRYIPLAQQANAGAVGRAGTGLPAGPQDPAYKSDISQF
ncbi:hypothetical protein OTERR_26250 [Oryzomicrobium terrae]|uniref:Lipoprotein n=1 Tax=Oryzomicrobium terrae TaxID=1735038 RepID=A0A5C1EAU2_9RHOO|nr:GNA1162 family protein [Oryzomicrobium terrae]QEL66101.1 hypothetical protein OTERR_26250 [Oryzomicrobium terrae]